MCPALLKVTSIRAQSTGIGVSVIVGVTDAVSVGVSEGVGEIDGVSVIVGVWVQVGAERIGPETPITLEVRNFSTMPSRSAFKVTEGQILLNKGRKNGCWCSTPAPVSNTA